jgi:uncharacterized UPF0160 family protein
MSFDYLCDTSREITAKFDPFVVSDDSNTDVLINIATHDGLFHIDESMACALLWLAGEDARIRRTRNPALLAQANIVVDVGQIYDPVTRRFDHHQQGFAETLCEVGCSTKLSAAGLVYRHYGKKILSRFVNDPVDVDRIYGRIYRLLIEYIDCMDNGIEPYEGGRRKVMISGTLHDRVRRLYPGDKASPEAISDAFKRAMHIALIEFCSLVSRECDSFFKTYPEVLAAVKSRFDFHPSGEVMYVPKGVFVGDHIYDIERTENIVGSILYYVSPASTGNNYNLTSVKIEGEIFKSRKDLPKQYGGLSETKLREISGVPDAVFVHVNSFIAVAGSVEGVMKLAGY